jgi:hypothetical protein
VFHSISIGDACVHHGIDKQFGFGLAQG